MTPEHALHRYFGFDAFQGPQRQIIECATRDQHTLVVMPTGGGKSLCYQIPAILRGSCGELTLIVSPLIALMQDQVAALSARGIPATFINSSLDRHQREQRYQQLADGEHWMVYVTPERFRKQEFRDAIGRRQITLLAVDEAHCISSWGHDFRPDYTRLTEIRAALGNPTTIALTATATPAVQDDIVAQLGLRDADVRRFIQGIERPNLKLGVEHVIDDDEKFAQIRQVIQQPAMQSGSGILYFTLIRTLESFSERLRSERIPHVVYHGELPRDERRDLQDAFMQGACPLVLATPAFGMGIDKADIRFVIHVELPGSLESYYQEVGRAGRDGKPSACVLLYDERDLATQMQFLEWRNPSAGFYETVYQLLSDRAEEATSFGIEWVAEQVHRRGGDRRLETTLLILDRWGVVAGDRPPAALQLVGPLPDELRDEAFLQQKRDRDLRRLYALVQYATAEPDARPGLLADYFGTVAE